jgi:hypothetical protein
MNTKYISIGLLSLAFVTLGAYAADNSHAKLTTWQASDGTVIGSPTLPAGAYTNWWVIFNNPDACGPPGCGGKDFPFNGGDPAVDASVLFATGGVVTDNGVGHFRAHLEEGDLSGEVLFGPGLTTADGAEIHIIVRYHGPAGVGDVLAAQTTTFGGGCSNVPNPYPIFPCYDPQAAPLPRP